MDHTPSPISRTDVAKLVDNKLREFFATSRKNAAAIDPSYEILWKYIEELALAGGKRIRPYMVLLSYQAFGSKSINSILSVALAYELIHLAMLIHDDIIDRDTTRRGVPNLTGRYLERYSHIDDEFNKNHYANSASLLGGDVLISSSYRLISESGLPPAQIQVVHQYMSQSIFEVVGGELIDTEAAFQRDKKPEPLSVARYKTTSYSFIGPLKTGAYLAGANEGSLVDIESYASSLGIAFQLTDDILGVFGNPASTGKSVDGDIREGKQTYLVEECLKRLNNEQREEFLRSFGRSDASSAEIGRVRDLIEESGARRATEETIVSYIDACMLALDRLNFDEVYNSAFVDLIHASTKRDV